MDNAALETINHDQAMKLIIGKTILDVKKTESQGRHLGISEVTFTDGSAIMLGGNHDDAHVWMYQYPSGDAPLVIDPEFD